MAHSIRPLYKSHSGLYIPLQEEAFEQRRRQSSDVLCLNQANARQIIFERKDASQYPRPRRTEWGKWHQAWPTRAKPTYNVRQSCQTYQDIIDLVRYNAAHVRRPSSQRDWRRKLPALTSRRRRMGQRQKANEGIDPIDARGNRNPVPGREAAGTPQRYERPDVSDGASRQGMSCHIHLFIKEAKTIQFAVDHSGEPLGNLVSQQFVETLWNDIKHPPTSYLDPKTDYRKPDGSGNSLTHPQLGAAHQPYARTVQPASVQAPVLPDPGVIFDAVMARKRPEKHPNKITSILFYLGEL